MKNMNQTIQTLKGFRDILPKDARYRSWLREQMTQVAASWGYEPIETPTLEPLELFSGMIGEDEKLFFKFTDQGGRQVALRYDQTVPTCRFVGQNFNQLEFPFRRYQFQPNFRAEKPQKGRFREFYQFDIDIFGVASPIADAETIAVTIDTYLKLGFSDVKILINSRSLMKDFPYQAIVAIDKLQKIGEDGVIQDMINKGIVLDDARTYLKQVKSLKPNQELQTIFDYLDNAGFSDSYQFEPTLARSFSYSQGPIWEIVVPKYSAGSLGGGERYDGMMKQITGHDIPATGIAYGFDRTLEAMKELDLLPKLPNTSKVLVTVFDSQYLKKSQQVSQALRKAGITTQLYPDPSTKIQKQLKYADKKNIPYVIVIGPDEAEKDLVTLKNMKSGDQLTIQLKEAIDRIN